MRIWMAAIVVALLQPAGARADEPKESSREAAVALGKDARELYDAGRYREALERFRMAEKIVHSPVFVVFIARCERQLGLMLEATATYQRILAEPLSNDAPDVWREALAEAEPELKALRAETPRLRIVVRGARADAVSIDGRRVSAAEPIAVNPGAHRIVATTPAGPVEKAIRVERGDGIVDVTLDAPAAPAPQPQPATFHPRARRNEALAIAGGTLVGFGGLNLIIGSVTGALALTKYNDVIEQCPEPPNCHGVDRKDYDTADSLAYVSTATFIVGGALAGAGIIMLIVDANRRPNTELVVGPSSASLRARFW